MSIFTVISTAIIAAAIIGVLLFGFWRRAHNPNRTEEYDERQRIARGRAYCAAFWTLFVCGAVSPLICSVLELSTQAFATGSLLSLTAGMLVFVCVAIWQHAFLGLSENPKRVLFACAAYAMFCIARLRMDTSAGTANDRVLDAVWLVSALVVLAIQLVRMCLDKHEEVSE